MTTLAERLRGVPSWQITLSIALFLLGFLVAAQFASEGPRVRYTTQERGPLVETVLGLQSQQEALKAEILEVRRRIGELEAQAPGAAAELRQLYADLEAARMAAGLLAVTGPGVAFRLEDADLAGVDPEGLVSARDVRVVVEELWLAGAEAVAVNAERITASSAVLDIGGSILVNSAYLAPPYTISAIGPPDMYERFTRSVAFVQFFQARIERHGLRLGVAELEALDLPAFAGTVNLRFGQPAESPGAGS
ncbi:MAG TPA: DUF881 domain-containing protein [Candidatus Deferrimicrobiaceae bacterium]|nr:DUF881 domain-containing protein [Candidatus Deferrimicrobiaceae bacterium]